MFSFNLVRWLKSLFRSRVKTIVKKPRYRLCAEVLEDRLAPAVFTWAGAHAIGPGGASNLWSDTANWQGNVAPTVGAPVQLNFQAVAAGGLVASDDIAGLVVDQLTI